MSRRPNLESSIFSGVENCWRRPPKDLLVRFIKAGGAVVTVFTCDAITDENPATPEMTCTVERTFKVRDGDELVLRVRDDGPGIPRNATRGVGLSNTEARLRQLYGEEQKLELSSPDALSGRGGVLVSIAIPFRPCAS